MHGVVYTITLPALKLALKLEGEEEALGFSQAASLSGTVANSTNKSLHGARFKAAMVTHQESFARS